MNWQYLFKSSNNFRPKFLAISAPPIQMPKTKDWALNYIFIYFLTNLYQFSLYLFGQIDLGCRLWRSWQVAAQALASGGWVSLIQKHLLMLAHKNCLKNSLILLFSIQSGKLKSATHPGTLSGSSTSMEKTRYSYFSLALSFTWSISLIHAISWWQIDDENVVPIVVYVICILQCRKFSLRLRMAASS